MTPQFSHRLWFLGWVWLPLATIAVGGCSSPVIFPQGAGSNAVAADIEALPDIGVTLIRDVTSPWATYFVKLEGVALVTGLNGTGSDPQPGPLRDTLVSEMETHDVKNPNQLLASPNTSLVLVRGFLPPGVRKGDKFDLEIQLPPRSETKSLRGGWLMKTRMREVAVLQNALHTGRVSGMAEGRLLVDTVFDHADDKVGDLRGRLLGGGTSLVSRPLGLEVKTENHSVRTSSLVGAAVNARFHTYERGIKKGVATPKRDNFVELEVHPRYRQNLGRYMRVVRNIALTENPADHVRRIESLERQLLEPSTAANAALQLEAIGKDGLTILHKATRATDPEVRFYAAEALAYMDDAEAAGPLAEAARNAPAFRWHAIAALSAMDHATAHDALADLLHVPSAETRYAAFRALRTRNPNDPLVRGEELGDEFSLHVIHTKGPPMVHFARSGRPEVVLFGDDLQLRSPSFLYAGKNIMLKADGPDRIKALRFAAREEDRHEACSTRLDDVVRTIVRLNGGYGDVLQAVQEAKARECLASRVVIDALPRPGRVYRRDKPGEAGCEEQPERLAATPLAGMFTLPTEKERADDEKELPFDVPEDKPKAKGVFGKMGAWLSGN